MIHCFRLRSEIAEKSSSNITRSSAGNGSMRRMKRSHVVTQAESSSTEVDSSPGSTPRQRTPLSRSLSSEVAPDSGDRQSVNNVSLARQKLIKSSERPKLKQSNSNSSVVAEDNTAGPKGILKSHQSGVKNVSGYNVSAVVKPPVPSRNKVNEMLKSGASRTHSSVSSGSDTSGDTGRRHQSRDSGNSSLDSSDPSTGLEWRLSVRSSDNNNNTGENIININI